jgi:hypothetical protein
MPSPDGEKQREYSNARVRLVCYSQSLSRSTNTIPTLRILCNLTSRCLPIPLMLTLPCDGRFFPLNRRIEDWYPSTDLQQYRSQTPDPVELYRPTLHMPSRSCRASKRPSICNIAVPTFRRVSTKVSTFKASTQQYMYTCQQNLHQKGAVSSKKKKLTMYLQCVQCNTSRCQLDTRKPLNQLTGGVHLPGLHHVPFLPCK